MEKSRTAGAMKPRTDKSLSRFLRIAQRRTDHFQQGQVKSTTREEVRVSAAGTRFRGIGSASGIGVNLPGGGHQGS